jgi:hypothetical protein
MNEYEPGHEREARREKNEVIDRLRAELAAAQERVREREARDRDALHDLALQVRERDGRIAEQRELIKQACVANAEALTRAETAERELGEARKLLAWLENDVLYMGSEAAKKVRALLAPPTTEALPCPCGDWSPRGPRRQGHPERWCDEYRVPPTTEEI